MCVNYPKPGNDTNEMQHRHQKKRQPQGLSLVLNAVSLCCLLVISTALGNNGLCSRYRMDLGDVLWRFPGFECRRMGGCTQTRGTTRGTYIPDGRCWTHGSPIVRRIRGQINRNISAVILAGKTDPVRKYWSGWIFFAGRIAVSYCDVEWKVTNKNCASGRIRRV